MDVETVRRIVHRRGEAAARGGIDALFGRYAGDARRASDRRLPLLARLAARPAVFLAWGRHEPRRW